MRILSFGEILWDIYPNNKFIGGAPLNFAAHFVKCGGEAYINSAVGTDRLGAESIHAVEQLGIHTDYIGKNTKPTGTCHVTLDERSIPQYHLADHVAYDDIVTPNVSENEFDALAFGTLALRHRVNRDRLEALLQRCRFPEIFVDINIRKPYISKETLLFTLRRATVLKISDEELPTVTALAQIDEITPERAAKSICRAFRNIGIVIVTLGDKGAFAYDAKSDTSAVCTAQKVKVISTVGAGDSFSAAFLAQYLSREPLSRCLAVASRVSGFVVSNTAAVPDYDFSLLAR